MRQEPTFGNSTQEFVFRKNDDIGAAAAEDDDRFLHDCFVDTGDLQILLDCSTPRRVIVGRTGSGKTALVREIATRKNTAIKLSPHSLSLNFIANNDVIQFFEEAGVNLSPFYSLLWKHIIVVELLKAYFHINTQESQKQTFAKLKALLKRDRIKELAVDYLENWGHKFWLTTEERMAELTSRIENSLSGSLGSPFDSLKLSAEAARKLTIEEKTQIVNRGKKAVSEVQIRELENLISVLDDAVFTDRQHQYYVTIDTLDEEWVDDRIRYRLIKSLIDTVRRFKKVENVKIIIALRRDLLDKVLHSTVDPGFQEEKYESLYMYVQWTNKELRELIEKRLNALVKHRYTTKSVESKDLFPNAVDKMEPLDYVISRTFLRPRDAILFLNECITHANGKPKFTAHIIKQAELDYSHKRLQSLATEWQIVHPNLKQVAEMFNGMKNHFAVKEITKEWLCERYEEGVEYMFDTTNDPITISLDKLYGGGGNFGSIRNSIVRNLHFVGLFGIKLGPTTPVRWAFESNSSLSPGQIRSNSIIHIHPMFYRALEIKS